MSSDETSSTSVSPLATALTAVERPVSVSTSPVNSPGWWTVTVRGSPLEGSMISTAPDRTTKNPKSLSPAWKSASPSRRRLRTAISARAAICPSSSLGKAMCWGSCSAMWTQMTGAARERRGSQMPVPAFSTWRPLPTILADGRSRR